MFRLKCIHCECDFDVAEKNRYAKIHRRQPGKVNECIDCATSGPVEYTGVMIYGHKTAGSVQINKDPRLTQYMLRSSPSAGTMRAMGVTLHKVRDGDVAHLADKDIAKRR